MIKELGSKYDPANLFLVSPQSSYTYRDLLAFSNVFYEKLQRLKIDLSSPIGLCAPSSDELVFIIAACWLNKIPFIPFNPYSKNENLSKRMKGFGLSLLISHNFEIKNQHRNIPIDTFDILSIKKYDPSSVKRSKYEISSSPHELFGYFFTSGTSGPPKTVPLKRRQMISGSQSSAQNILPCPNDSWLLCLPLYHIGGISIILRSLLYGSAIFRLGDFNSNEVCKLLSENKKIVAASLVPTMYKRILDNTAFSTHERVQAILLGGGPIFGTMLQESFQRNIPVITSYGMTETCAQIAAKPLSKKNKKSVGKIFERNSIQIRDMEGQELPFNKSGTIWLRGPQIFDGYLNVPRDDFFDANDWFNTGDYGRLDKEGNLYIEARRMDRIITGGENVSPLEVESALRHLDSIQDVAVLGIPDEEWGQKVVAVVVLRESADSSPKKIQNKLKESLESYKIPKVILLHESLPRTDTGKIKRSELYKFF